MKLQGTDQCFRLSIDSRLYPEVDIATRIRNMEVREGDVRLIDDASDLILEVESSEGEAKRVCRRVFGRIHRYPLFPRLENLSADASTDPVLSCIIVLTENDHFVRDLLLPSILQNSSEDLEIIIVSNGSGSELSFPSYVRWVSSEYRWVARAYNRGVDAARGRYVALFHDDCLINDPLWIEKCLDGLQNSNCRAVSTEVLHRSDDLRVAKSVPLVMEKEDYLQINGFDSAYYFGIEDVDFTYKMLERGWGLRKAEIDCVHFNGMSSILVGGSEFGSYDILFSCYIFNKNLLSYLAYKKVENMKKEKVFKVITDRNYLFFLNKFEGYLRPRHSNLLKRIREFESRVALWKSLSPKTWKTVSSNKNLAQYYKFRDNVG